ncbi:MAG: hypothetical protein ACK5LR_03425 [Mangrovibacterium sp.]
MSKLNLRFQLCENQVRFCTKQEKEETKQEMAKNKQEKDCWFSI